MQDKDYLKNVSCLTIDPDTGTVYACSQGRLVSIKTCRSSDTGQDERKTVKVKYRTTSNVLFKFTSNLG